MRARLEEARPDRQGRHVVRRPRDVQGRGPCCGFLAAVLAAVAAPAAAQAGASPWTQLDHAAVRLLVAGPEGDARERRAAVEMRLDPGTLTYWRQPGDAGLPPRFDSSRSTNVATVTVGFPAPRLLDAEGAQLFGYRDAVSFPLTVTVTDPTRPATLVLTVDAALCRTLCLPVSATFDMPLSKASDPEADRLVDLAEATVPRRVAPGVDSALGVAAASLPSLAATVVAVQVRSPEPASLFTEGPEGWVFQAVEVVPSDSKSATVAVPVLQHPDGPVPGDLPLVFTLVSGSGAIEVATRVDAAPPAP